MKLFRIFLSLFLIVVAIWIVSLFFPHTYRIEKRIVIAKPRETVYRFMNDFRNWERWSLWNRSLDSSLNYFYGRHAAGDSARQYFHGNRIGSGRFRFDTCIVNERLVYDLYMNAGEVSARGTFKFKDTTGGTTLIWLDSGDVGNNPIYRFMIPSKVESTEKTFEDGLGRIRDLVQGE